MKGDIEPIGWVVIGLVACYIIFIISLVTFILCYTYGQPPGTESTLFEVAQGQWECQEFVNCPKRQWTRYLKNETLLYDNNCFDETMSWCEGDTCWAFLHLDMLNKCLKEVWVK